MGPCQDRFFILIPFETVYKENKIKIGPLTLVGTVTSPQPLRYFEFLVPQLQHSAETIPGASADVSALRTMMCAEVVHCFLNGQSLQDGIALGSWALNSYHHWLMAPAIIGNCLPAAIYVIRATVGTIQPRKKRACLYDQSR